MILESDAPGILSLCSDLTCLKCEGLALEMHIIWCKNSIGSWNLYVEVPLTLGEPISVAFFLANNTSSKATKYSVSLRIQSECGKIRTRKNSVFGHFSPSATSILSILWLSAFSASHIFLKMVPGVFIAKFRNNIQTKLQHNMNYSYKLSQYLTEKFIFWSNVNFKERQKTTFNQMNATKIMFFGKWSKKLWPLINVLV